MNLTQLKQARYNALATAEALTKLIEQEEALQKPRKRQNKREERSLINKNKIRARLNKNHNHLAHALEIHSK